jgi:hypothetical protein
MAGTVVSATASLLLSVALPRAPALVWLALFACAAAASGCSQSGEGHSGPAVAAAEARRPVASAAPEIAWRRLGTWSGRGSLQTESFTSDTGYFRVTWKADEPAPSASGAFRLALHSAISGRPLAVVVESEGPGGGTAYAHEDPRVFYAVVEASALDWSFTVEEGFAGLSGAGKH